MILLPDEPRHDRFAFSDTRRWVLIGAGIGTAAYAALAVVSIVAHGWTLLSHESVLIVTGITCLIGGLMARSGRIFAGGMVAIAGVWTEVQSNLLTTHEFPSPSLLATSAILIATTLLLSRAIPPSSPSSPSW